MTLDLTGDHVKVSLEGCVHVDLGLLIRSRLLDGHNDHIRLPGLSTTDAQVSLGVGILNLPLDTLAHSIDWLVVVKPQGDLGRVSPPERGCWLNHGALGGELVLRVLLLFLLCTKLRVYGNNRHASGALGLFSRLLGRGISRYVERRVNNRAVVKSLHRLFLRYPCACLTVVLLQG